MRSSSQRPAKYRPLKDHSPTTKKRWDEITAAIQGVQLPVTFHSSTSSQAVLVDEDLDAAGWKAFAPVREWVEGVKAGTTYVRAITALDVENILHALEDTYEPNDPESSVDAVASFADQVLEALNALTE